MSDPWRLLITSPAEGPWNMAVDEVILESVIANNSRSTLRLYAWHPPCLSLGYAQPYSDVEPSLLESFGWGVVRRPTGGRAILHTDELTYAVVAPSGKSLFSGGVVESYHRIAKALATALIRLGLPVETSEHRLDGNKSKNPVCFEVPSTFEITANQKKILGSAQARRKGGILQHGSFPLGGDIGRVTRVLSFQSESVRTQAYHRLLAKAATAESIIGRPVSWDGAAQAFVSSFCDIFDLVLIEEPLTQVEISRVDEILEQKYTNPKWLKRI